MAIDDKNRTRVTYLRDMAMNNIGAFLKDKIKFTETDYYDDERDSSFDEAECSFSTTDGKSFILLIHRID